MSWSRLTSNDEQQSDSRLHILFLSERTLKGQFFLVCSEYK